MNIETNSKRRVLALALVLSMLATLLCGCAAQTETDDLFLENAPAGLPEAKQCDALELPLFNVIGGTDDPFAEIPDDTESPEQRLDISGMLDDTDTPDYVLDYDPDVKFEVNDGYEVTMPRELMGLNVTVTFAVLDTECYPVKNALVEIGEYSGRTNENGEVKLEMTTGIYEMYVSATGYTPYSEDVAITLGSTYFSIQVANSNKIRVLLDSADLHPYVTNYPELEKYLNDLFAVLFHDGMDTYDKVLACYDYIIDHMDYKQPKHWISGKEYWPCAHQSFLEGIGVCNCYSAMFTVMMRHIGLDCSIVTGYTTSIKGGYTTHDWTTVCIGGKYYVFDCQVEDAIADRTASKEVKYVRFCLAEPHAKYQYRSRSRESCIKDFEKYLLANGHFVED